MGSAGEIIIHQIFMQSLLRTAVMVMIMPLCSVFSHRLVQDLKAKLKRTHIHTHTYIYCEFTHLFFAGNVFHKIVDWTESSALVNKTAKFWTVEIS